MDKLSSFRRLFRSSFCLCKIPITLAGIIEENCVSLCEGLSLNHFMSNMFTIIDLYRLKERLIAFPSPFFLVSLAQKTLEIS